MEYNEQAAIDYMRAHTPAGMYDSVSDDEILNLIDIIWDYYEEHGLLDIDMADDDEDDTVDLDDLTAYVKKMIAKDKQSPLRALDVRPLVEAEIEFEASIDQF